MSGGWKETSSDWESALCVSTLHDALRESERQRKVVHKALNSAVKANREMEEELKVLRGERKKYKPLSDTRSKEKATPPPHEDLLLARQEVDGLKRLVEDLRQQLEEQMTLAEQSFHMLSKSELRVTDLGSLGMDTRPDMQDAEIQVDLDLPLRGKVAAWLGGPGANGSNGSFGGSSTAAAEVELIGSTFQDLLEETEKLRMDNAMLRQQVSSSSEERSVCLMEVEHRYILLKDELIRSKLKNLVRFYGRKERIAFRLWAQKVQRHLANEVRKGNRQKEGMIFWLCRKKQGEKKKRVMSAWKGYSHQRALVRKTLMRAFGGKKILAEEEAMRRWKECTLKMSASLLRDQLHIAEAKALEQHALLIQRFEFRRDHNIAKRVFAAWRRRLKMLKLGADVLKRMELRKRSEVQSRHFQKWRSCSLLMSTRDRLMKTITSRLTAQLLCKGFYSWRQYSLKAEISTADREKREGEHRHRISAVTILSMILLGNENRRLLGRFSAWKRHSVCSKTLEERHCGIAGKVLKRMRSAKVMCNWKSFTQRKKLLRRVLARTLGGKRVDLLTLAYRRWVCKVQWLMRTEQSLSWLVTVMALKCKGRALNQWMLSHVSEKKEELLDKRKAATVSTFSKTKNFLRASRIFRSWVDFASTRCRMRAIILRLMGRRRLCLLKRALGTWQGTVEKDYLGFLAKELAADPSVSKRWTISSISSSKLDVLSAVREKQRQVMHLEHVVGRYQDKTLQDHKSHLLWRCYMAWAIFTKKKKWGRQTMTKYLQRKKIRWLGDAWKRVHATLDSRARQEEIMSRLIKGSIRRKLHHAFCHWREYLLQDMKRRHEVSTLKTKEEKKCLGTKAIARVVARLDKKIVCSAFVSWSRSITRRNEHESKLRMFKQAALKYHKFLAMRSYRTWTDFVRTRLRMRTFVHKFFGGKRKALIGKGFRTWLEETRRLEEGLREGKVVHRIYKLIVGRKVFLSWREFVRLRKNLRSLMTKLVGGKTTIMMHHAFRTWASSVDGMTDLGRLLDSIAKKMRRRSLLEGVRRWELYMKESKMHEVLMARYIKGTKMLRLGWNALEKSKMKRAFVFLNLHARMHGCLMTERQKALEYEKTMEKLVRCRGFIVDKCLDKCRVLEERQYFLRWVAWRLTSAYRKKAFGSILKRWAIRTYTKGFSVWQSDVPTLNILARGFHSWKGLYVDVKHRQRLRGMVVKKIERAYRGRMKDGFEIWKRTRVQGKRARLAIMKLLRWYEKGRTNKMCRALGFKLWRERVRACGGRQKGVLSLARIFVQGLFDADSVVEVMHIVQQYLRPIAQQGSACFLMADERRGELWTVVKDQNKGIGTEEFSFGTKKGLVGAAYNTGSIIHVPDAVVDYRFDSRVDLMGGGGDGGGKKLEMISVPVWNGRGMTLGVLHVIKRRRSRDDERFAVKHLLVIQLCASLVSMAIVRIHESGDTAGAEEKLTEERVHSLDLESMTGEVLEKAVKVRQSSERVREKLITVTTYARHLEKKCRLYESKIHKVKSRLRALADGGSMLRLTDLDSLTKILTQTDLGSTSQVHCSLTGIISKHRGASSG